MRLRRTIVFAGVAALVLAAGWPALAAGGPDPAREGAGSGERVTDHVIAKERLLPARPMVEVLATTIAPGIVHSQYDNGVNEADILEVDLTVPSVGVTYTYPGTVASASAMTTQARRSGAIAAVNGDFFDIGNTNAPRGVGIDAGTLLNAPASNWNESLAISTSGDHHAGRLVPIFLDATIGLPGGTTVPATKLNSPAVPANGLAVFTPVWGSASRALTVGGATRVREVEVRAGVVSAVRTAAGGTAIPDDGVVLVGRETGADSLAGLTVGSPVSVTYRPRYTGAAPKVAVSGNLVLLRDGVVDVPSHPRHPRTAVGFSADGTRMWLVALDGRSSASQGMTYADLGAFMRSLGADDALNLDGGGSTTMVAKNPGEVDLSVQNVPSDGSQRAVPNGFGLTSASFPAACIRATFNYASYPTLRSGASGGQVLALNCLLKLRGALSGAPGSSFGSDTESAVRAFQQGRGLAVDGVVGPRTWTALLALGSTPTLRSGSSGIAVRRLQRALTAALGRTVGIDGAFGSQTNTAVRDYQRTRGLAVDGIVGSATWGALQAGR